MEEYKIKARGTPEVRSPKSEVGKRKTEDIRQDRKFRLTGRDGPPGSMMIRGAPAWLASEGGGRGQPRKARGQPVECMNEDGRRKSEVGKTDSEYRSRGKPKGKTRLWLTLKTTFFNTKNNVFSQWYALWGRKSDVVVDNLHLLTLSSAGE